MSTPPTSTAHLRLMREPNASNCSAIWMASSRVGESTNAKYGWGFFNKFSRIGSAKAPVFPDPVCASPMTSCPFMA
eukprot:CAMPEP_0114265946 /NCGR_PEP_ID=MMETSP0058-20121206/24280_1 /TAXON_ID=36894 /ORGANISM="Pyramimonas parkeae, CCMP726" /LENGTH=75 /DNA_ID=CAMNT_0001383259 /DNA_START=57 /DNA_END=284 /DNA_ORIENTATION=-